MILPALLCVLTTGLVADTLAVDQGALDGPRAQMTFATNHAEGSGSRSSSGGVPSMQQYVKEGDAFVSDGRLPEAMHAFTMAADAGGWHEPAVLKRLATVGRWTRQFDASRNWLKSALVLSPGDEEASDALNGIRMQRSLHLFGSVGGGEVDYATRTYEAGAFAGWVDWMDALGGYSMTDKLYYRRSNVWADVTFFPTYAFSLRIGGKVKVYEYPASATVQPDQNAYSRSAHMQLEFSYAYGYRSSVSIEGEFFRPSFYWNGNLHADNFKVSLSVRQELIGGIYGTIVAATLRDPDPDSFASAVGGPTIDSFTYEHIAQVGGGIGIEQGGFAAEVKIVPDRDLDRSIAWSVFGAVRYDVGPIGIAYDALYDRARETAGRGFSVSRVNIVSVATRVTPFIEARLGAKFLTRTETDMAPFLALKVRTGL